LEIGDYFERAVDIVRCALAAQQTRILEPLVVANGRLQTEIYKILTVEQQRSLME